MRRPNDTTTLASVHGGYASSSFLPWTPESPLLAAALPFFSDLLGRRYTLNTTSVLTG